jgi:hypothetical protein
MNDLLKNKDLMLRYSRVVQDHMTIERDTLDKCIQLMKRHDDMLKTDEIQEAYKVMIHATKKYLVLCSGRAVVEELESKLTEEMRKATKAMDDLNETKKKHHGDA